MGPRQIKIIEVGPRDGLQNEFMILPTQFKTEFVQDLINAGIEQIEVTSFVKPDKIPQMADAIQLVESLNKLYPQENHLKMISLVPNRVGLEAALKCQVKHIAVFTATSDAFNKKNINATVDESLQKILPVIEEAKKQGLSVRGYISTVFGCPYQGETSIDKLKEVATKLLNAGVEELSLGDTIGVGNPLQTKNIIKEVKKVANLSQVAMHFHDTQGMALANIFSSYEEGVVNFDSSAGGLGGCPYANGATGNVATEDVVNLFHSMGLATGIDLEKLIKASNKVINKIGRTSPSKYFQYAKKRD